MNNNPKNYVVITDLDGTLLDHDTYSFAAAEPSLQQLAQHQIPLVINSSKTEAEIISLRQQLSNTHPYIIENGSAIHYPENYFASNTKKEPKNRYKKHILGRQRQEIIDIIREHLSDKPSLYRGYHQSSINDIMDMTGLSAEDAAMSAQRQYTEPLQWLGDTQQKADFINAAKKYDLHALQGGRFLHLMGNTDKGAANIELKALYEAYYQAPVTTIVLGDSHNDIAMLQAADIAVVIRSAHHKPPEFEHPHKLISQQYGPNGWHECIQQLLFNSGDH